MNAREQAREAAWNAWEGVYLAVKITDKQVSEDCADAASDVWEPIVQRAVQILACATADCDQPPWQQEAMHFILEHGKEAPVAELTSYPGMADDLRTVLAGPLTSVDHSPARQRLVDWSDFALTAALNEAEMVEAIRNAPCVKYGPNAVVMWCSGPLHRHPECAARAVLDLILGEKP